uniref:Uncharacterized protein n=1 Tax=Arundo donax TaxID=35708 RepID=A0A0A9B015_ARUDO
MKRYIVYYNVSTLTSLDSNIWEKEHFLLPISMWTLH